MIVAPKMDVRQMLKDNGGIALVGLFRDSAKELSNRGWCQGKLMTMSGEVCALGAIDVASNNDPGKWLTATLLLWYYVSDGGAKDIPSVSRWNDEHCTSKAEVVSTLEDCADWLEEML